jgi:flagellar basal-body rod modification protein FlgD
MSTTPTAAVSYGSTGFTGVNAASGTVATQNEAGSQDRFLKLLVAQMQNQDPLNPMDNAQVTSQMAQINTVNGVEKLNTTVQGLNTQFVQMQALQGASLVGRDVVVQGDKFSTTDKGLTQGGFDLGGVADSVKVEVLNAAGRVIDTVDLGAQSAGRHGFDWTPPAGVNAELGAKFRLVAKSGAAAVPATPLMRDTVNAVTTGGDSLTLELDKSGSVSYADIKAFN